MARAVPKHDAIIRGGHVINPANGLDAVLDLEGPGLSGCGFDRSLSSQRKFNDASGKIVTPGLIDLHIHGYHLVFL